MYLEEHNHCLKHCFGVKTLSGTLLGPAFNKTNLAWAVRISGDGGQEGMHLARNTKGVGEIWLRVHVEPGPARAARSHYTFNMRDVSKVTESARACSYFLS